jgi:hypothetical protein
METLLKTDILPESLTENHRRIIIQAQFSAIVNNSTKLHDRLRTPAPAKTINEFYKLVKNVIDDYERRSNTINDGKVFYTEEEPDIPKDKNAAITISLQNRFPGAFGKGAPFEADIQNQKPMFREEFDDEENPGYRVAILGYWHDNEVVFTVWARTNKTANDKALWFENIMQEYSWYFTSQGVARIMFMKRDADTYTEVNGAKLYGRPMHYFVRTETLRTVKEKVIEEVLVKASISNGLTA